MRAVGTSVGASRRTSSTGRSSNWVTQAVVGSLSSTAAGRSAGRRPASVSVVASDELASTPATPPPKSVTAWRERSSHGR